MPNYKMTRQLTIFLFILLCACGQRNNSVSDSSKVDTIQSFINFDNNIVGHIEATAEFDGKLFFAGKFVDNKGIKSTNIIAWNGKGWESVGDGINGKVMTLAVYNNELYAGGTFDKAGEINVQNIAKWDGKKWTDVSGGTKGFFVTQASTTWINCKETKTQSSINGYVNLLTVINNELYMSGRFDTVGKTPAHNFAKWNGKNWSAMGRGINDNILAMQLYKGELYVAGEFDTVDNKPFNYIAKWNGKEWQSVGQGTDRTIYSLQVFNDELYAGGCFTTADNTNALGIAKWNGNKWTSVDKGMNVAEMGSVGHLTTYSHELYAGGLFDSVANIQANGIAKWNGKYWQPLDKGLDNFIDSLPVFSSVDALSVFGNDLFIAGDFLDTVNNKSTNKIVRWTTTLKQK